LSRCASATNFSIWVRDFIPSWNASTQSARYCGWPNTTGLGEGLGEIATAGVGGAELSVVVHPISDATRRIAPRASPARRRDFND